MSDKIMVGMSGGVDSSVSALLLKEKGYDVTGVNCLFYIKENDGFSEGKDAKLICDRLGLPFETLDLREDFRSTVIEDFIAVYEKGGTPNPCIVCNKHLKFGKLLDSATEKGFNLIATGHYVQSGFDGSRYYLKKGADEKKDQSYFLYCLSQHQLSHSLFPLGELSKDEVREIAEKNSLITARKRDSQDICFVPDGDYAAFIEKTSGKTYPCGDFTDTKGNILGEHKGIIRYTIGQRRGLGLALPASMYVKEKSPIENKVILCYNEELFTRNVDAYNINLIACERIDSPIRVRAKTRYTHKEQWATVWQTDENTLHAEFDEPVRAVTSGQALVLYDGSLVVGGGTIR